MKSRMALAVLFCGLLSVGHAENLNHRVGVTGLAQAGFPLGQQSVKDQARSVGPILGGLVSYGLSSHWGIGASYDNFDLGHGLRVEPILFQGLYRFCPDSRWSPTASFGGGISRGVDAKNFHHAAAKAGLGLDYFLTPAFALGPQVNYYYVANTQDSPRHLSALGAGLSASYYFDGQPAEPKAPKTAAAPAPAVVPAAIAVALAPAAATLEQGQTQSFNATVSGSANTGVTWSRTPELGVLSPAGVYTAPATIALAEKVTVTAASLADPAKTASAVVQLVPPASAPQQVSIQLNVLFDTGKAIVKPVYRAEIQKVADFMKTYASARAEIEGHTDNVGAPAMNQALSQRRADAVRQELIQQFGVPADRLTAKGYGETRPLSDNKTAQGRTQNRRVVATLTATK